MAADSASAESSGLELSGHLEAAGPTAVPAAPGTSPAGRCRVGGWKPAEVISCASPRAALGQPGALPLKAGGRARLEVLNGALRGRLSFCAASGRGGLQAAARPLRPRRPLLPGSGDPAAAADSGEIDARSAADARGGARVPGAPIACRCAAGTPGIWLEVSGPRAREAEMGVGAGWG